MNNCPPVVRDGEGNTYNTIIIGTQCWMAENQNIGVRIDGGIYPGDFEIQKYCYDNLESNCDIYGGLYTWQEAMDWVEEEGAQGICPDRWHIPTDGELLVLADALGGKPIAGGKMKTTGTTPVVFSTTLVITGAFGLPQRSMHSTHTAGTWTMKTTRCSLTTTIRLTGFQCGA